MFNLALRISPVNGLGVGCRSRPLFGGLGASDFGKLCSLGNQGRNLVNCGLALRFVIVELVRPDVYFV